MTINAARVPMLSPAHSQSVSLIMSKHATITELATVIEADPAITLALLRFANSAVNAPVQPAARVSDAIVRLGMEETRRIVLGVVLQQTTAGELEGTGIDLDEMWRHLIATAILADAVASTDESLRSIRPFAFGAGMLHDIGRLALAAASPPHYQRVMRRVATGATTLEAERIEFNTDHQELGREVAAVWQLSPELAAAIESHHEPADGVAEAVRRGRLLAAKIGVGDGVVPPEAPSHTEADDDAIAVMHVGGPAQVNARIDWFRGALPTSELDRGVSDRVS